MKSGSWILLICLLSLLAYADETQEQQVERLIKQLRDQDSNVRANTAEALGEIGGGAVDAAPALIQALQDQNANVRGFAAEALGNIGTPEALKAITTVITSFFPLFTKKYTVYE